MADINSMLEGFREIAQNPRAQLDKTLAEGRKAVGCMPVYCPQEMVYAAGMVPFGVWGTYNLELSESKRYFPAFICSIMQECLELGLRGKLKGLSAMMIPALCDSMKCMGQNWKASVTDIPFIPVYYPQNRASEAGIEYLAEQYKEIAGKLLEVGGQPITEAALSEAIDLCNAHRSAMRRFSAAATLHPELVNTTQRSWILKSAWFCEAGRHAKMLDELTEALRAAPKSTFKGVRLVTTGIIADDPELLEVLDELGIAVATDEVAHESRQYRCDVPEGGDGYTRLARYMANIEGCSVLFDPKKKRADIIMDMVNQTQADGVLVLVTQFCDPEEFDYVVLKRRLEAEGVPHLMLTLDQQGGSAGKLRTALETFAEVVRA